jgi:hypothetical protein
MTTRRRTAMMVLVLGVATLTGCTDDGPAAAPTPAPATAVPTTAAPAVSSAPATGDDDDAGDDTSAAFVATVQSKLPQIAADRRDEEIALIAEQACTGLSAGLEAEQVIAETRTLGTADAEATDEATARELVKLAIDTVCLDQAKRVDEF